MATVELDRPPKLAALYGRAVLSLVPGRSTPGDALPDTALVLRHVAVDRSRLAEYARVCGFRLTDTLPPTYPQVLAFPLVLRLLTQPEFPFPAAGVVHVANRIEQRRPLDASQRLDLAVRAQDLRAHPRGRQVDLVTTASVAGAEVWRGVATYLRRAVDRSRGGAGSHGDPVRPPVPAARWRVEPRVASAYAAVSGDRNPIHTSRLGARAFGYRRRIAHGMWTKARCLAQLSPRLPEAYAVEVAFKAPLELPATVAFSVSPGLEFAVHGARTGVPHLIGAVTTPR